MRLINYFFLKHAREWYIYSCIPPSYKNNIFVWGFVWGCFFFLSFCLEVYLWFAVLCSGCLLSFFVCDFFCAIIHNKVLIMYAVQLTFTKYCFKCHLYCNTLMFYFTSPRNWQLLSADLLFIFVRFLKSDSSGENTADDIAKWNGECRFFSNNPKTSNNKSVFLIFNFFNLYENIVDVFFLVLFPCKCNSLSC